MVTPKETGLVMKKKFLVLFPALLIAAGLAAAAWWLTWQEPQSGDLQLYGNVEIRDALLAFNEQEMIAEVLAEEGDAVQTGQLLARLRSGKLQQLLAEAEAHRRWSPDFYRHFSFPDCCSIWKARLALSRWSAMSSRPGTSWKSAIPCFWQEISVRRSGRLSMTMQQALLGSIMPAVILSGFTTPIENMPEWLQIGTLANPLRFVVTALRQIFLEGAGTTDIWPQLWPMVIIAMLTLPPAAWLFRHRVG